MGPEFGASLKGVLDEVALELGGGVEDLLAEVALVLHALLDDVGGDDVGLDLGLRREARLALDALVRPQSRLTQFLLPRLNHNQLEL